MVLLLSRLLITFLVILITARFVLIIVEIATPGPATVLISSTSIDIVIHGGVAGCLQRSVGLVEAEIEVSIRRESHKLVAVVVDAAEGADGVGALDALGTDAGEDVEHAVVVWQMV